MKHLGLVALAVIVPVCAYILWRWPADKRRSFSEHVAERAASQSLFSISFTFATVLYYLYLFLWLGPHLGAAVAFYWIVGVAFVAQLVLTWVPAAGSRKLEIHTNAALLVAIAMLASVGTILASASPPLGSLQVTLCGIFLVYGLVLAYLYIRVPRARAHFLYFQLSYFIAFWLLMLVLTYT